VDINHLFSKFATTVTTKGGKASNRASRASKPKNPEASNLPSSALLKRRSSCLALIPVKQAWKGKPTEPVHIPYSPSDSFQANGLLEPANSAPSFTLQEHAEESTLPPP